MKTLEDLRWKRFEFPGGGHLCLVDVMGDDLAVVDAARISYGEGTRPVMDDRALIRYMARHGHTSPFEQAELKFLVQVPMDTWRQWIRHRTANVNEYSTRYSEAVDSCATTGPSEWRAQSVTNKQGSGPGELVWPSGELADSCKDAFGEGFSVGDYLTAREQALQGLARAVYKERLAAGVAREQARKDLPLSTHTRAYWKVDLHNLFHFLRLRMDSHAQQEIRRPAEIIGREIVAHLFPICWEAFEDYRLNAVTFSGPEAAAMASLIADARSVGPFDTIDAGVLKEWFPGERNRERDEFAAKLRRIGFPIAG